MSDRVGRELIDKAKHVNIVTYLRVKTITKKTGKPLKSRLPSF